MEIILLFLLIFFVIIPLVRVAGAIFRARNTAKDFYDKFRQAASSAGAYATGSRQSARQPVKKKKIDPSQGEYVAFEEVTVGQEPPAQGGDERSRRIIEPQVVDVEWEDIR